MANSVSYKYFCQHLILEKTATTAFLNTKTQRYVDSNTLTDDTYINKWSQENGSKVRTTNRYNIHVYYKLKWAWLTLAL